MTIIAGLRELREPGQPEPLHELIQLFLRDSRPKLERMEAAMARKDFPALGLAAHSLKGSASSLGARRLADLCAQLEKHAKLLPEPQYLTEAADLLLTIRGEFHRVETALLVELQK
jgi:HPt (histidine-containing phosphotransfer) domain-containing protein